MLLTGIAEQLLRAAAGAPLEARMRSLRCPEQPLDHAAKLSAISPLLQSTQIFLEIAEGQSLTFNGD